MIAVYQVSKYKQHVKFVYISKFHVSLHETCTVYNLHSMSCHQLIWCIIHPCLQLFFSFQVAFVFYFSDLFSLVHYRVREERRMNISHNRYVGQLKVSFGLGFILLSLLVLWIHSSVLFLLLGFMSWTIGLKSIHFKYHRIFMASWIRKLKLDDKFIVKIILDRLDQSQTYKTYRV